MEYRSAFDPEWSKDDITAHVSSSIPPGHEEDQAKELEEFVEGHDWEFVREFDPRNVWDPMKARRWLEIERKQSIRDCGDDLWGHMLDAPTDCPVVLLYSGEELEEVVDGNHRLAAHAAKGWTIPAIIGRPRETRSEFAPCNGTP